MNMTLKRKLFEPKEIKEMYPVSAEGCACKKENDRQIQDVLKDVYGGIKYERRSVSDDATVNRADNGEQDS